MISFSKSAHCLVGLRLVAVQRHIRLPRGARAQGHPQPGRGADLRQIERVVGAVDVHRGVHRNAYADSDGASGPSGDMVNSLGKNFLQHMGVPFGNSSFFVGKSPIQIGRLSINRGWFLCPVMF